MSYSREYWYNRWFYKLHHLLLLEKLMESCQKFNNHQDAIDTTTPHLSESDHTKMVMVNKNLCVVYLKQGQVGLSEGIDCSNINSNIIEAKLNLNNLSEFKGIET